MGQEVLRPVHSTCVRSNGFLTPGCSAAVKVNDPGGGGMEGPCGKESMNTPEIGEMLPVDEF